MDEPAGNSRLKQPKKQNYLVISGSTNSHIGFTILRAETNTRGLKVDRQARYFATILNDRDLKK